MSYFHQHYQYLYQHLPQFYRRHQIPRPLGERGSGIRARGAIQDFHKLRDECLRRGTMFEDTQFPASDESLYYSRRPSRNIEWKRPGEIASSPQLFVEGASRFDIRQGELGDCWLLAAMANLTLYTNLFKKVVPDDQDFADNYAGIFHFRFWQYGRWVDVVVDDRLPTCYGKLLYLQSAEEDEFWSALLEKAYAKLHGSYEALQGGTTCEAMEDFTGGVSETYDIHSAPPNLYQIMLKAYARWSLMSCSIEPDPDVLEARTPHGLVRGHAYSLTKVNKFDITVRGTSGKIPLLRLRNPWGNDTEWNGPWSDQSPEWRLIPDDEKEDIGLTFEKDGEFWMSYRDFMTNFSRLEICNLSPDTLAEEDVSAGKKRWEMSVFEGEWVRGVTAGGCRNFPSTFWINPQYRITLENTDDDEDEQKCTIIVALMQKNRRAQKRLGVDLLQIGFCIYHLEDPENAPKPLPREYFLHAPFVAASPAYTNLREVSSRLKLSPGVYCIVPSTYEPDQQGEFLLRVFSEQQTAMEENDQEVGMSQEQSKIEPPERMDKVYQLFRKVAGEDMEVDWEELKEVLDVAMNNETGNEGFAKDVCRSMISLMDVDRSGKLGYEEFKNLFLNILHWKGVFLAHDKDSSGFLSLFELRHALNTAGYRLNYHLLNILAHRYGTKDGRISFDDFMMCAIRLKAMIETFKERDTDNTNTASFTLGEWVEKTLYS